MVHALCSYHGPHRINDTTFCSLRDIWARQEHANQIDKYIKKRSGNIRNNTVEKWSILEATSSSSVQKYLKRQTNGSISYVKESLRECDWQFGVYHNSSTMTFSLDRSFFSYVISNRSRSILIGSSIFMPLSRSHMVGISKAFKLLGNYCDELPKLFSFFQSANFTVDIFWLQREFYRQIKTMCPSYFIYLFCFRFFFCCRLIDIVSLKSVCTCDACDYKWYFIFLRCICRDQINMLHWLNAHKASTESTVHVPINILQLFCSMSLSHCLTLSFSILSIPVVASIPNVISHMRPFHTKTMHRTSDRMR